MKDFFSHPNAIVESIQIGKGTHIWAFAHVLPGASCNEFIAKRVRLLLQCWEITGDLQIFLLKRVGFLS